MAITTDKKIKIGLKMSIMSVLSNSLQNGQGMRDVIFFAGCDHHCPQCQNPSTHDIYNGVRLTVDEVFKHLTGEQEICDGLTLSGGDPFKQPKAIVEIVTEYRKRFADRDVWCYTGYRLEELLELAETDRDIKNALEVIDILVDGKYNYKLNPHEDSSVIDLSYSNPDRDSLYTSYKYSGSLNQRLWKRNTDNSWDRYIVEAP